MQENRNLTDEEHEEQEQQEQAEERQRPSKRRKKSEIYRYRTVLQGEADLAGYMEREQMSLQKRVVAQDGALYWR